MRSVLVIDDNPAVAISLDVLFGLRDIRTQSATSPAAGLAILDQHPVDLVVQDMNFSADTTSGEEGAQLFHAIRSRHADMPVILLTAWAHLETAVELVKAGAVDYLAKPWDDVKLLATVENLLELSAATREVSRLHEDGRRRRHALAEQFDLRGTVFTSTAMERVIELACRIARAEVPVLITGPSGAGKERIAEIVQANSANPNGPFVTVNCGALPAELIEAELFGAEAGAYTGASNKPREGRFEAADGGSLFLDEIGNLPLSGQMKLLRVIESGQFERLGSSRTRQVRVRVISATNADLPAMIRQGQFREDLYYRLNLIELRVPPLGERRDDVMPLAQAFLAGRASLDDSARAALMEHSWPGNVRELKNAIERAVLLGKDGVLSSADLGLAAPRASTQRSAPVVEPDRAMIEAALSDANGVISQAASALGLSRQALYRRMEKLGIDA